MAKKVTPANTGLSIARSKNKFTASWKIKAKKMKTQKLRYRTHNGKKWSSWTTKTLSKSATSYSFSLSPANAIKHIHVQTQALSEGDYKASEWSSSRAVFDVSAPPTPTLTVTNNSANSTTFSWSISSSDTNTKWFYRCYYRTKCDTTPSANTGWSSWTYASKTSYSYTDTTLGTTRSFQIKAVGPGGTSLAKPKRHVIGTSPVATWAGDAAVTCTELSSYYSLTYHINLSGSTYTVDSIVPQYYIGMPDSDMECPSDASWTNGSTWKYSNGNKNYTLAATTSELISADECLWARIKTEHDSVPSYSDAYRVITGMLKAPTATISMGTPKHSGFSVSITIDSAGTSVPGAYVQVYLEKYSAAGIENYILIGTIPNGTSSATISSTEDLTSETGYAIHIRNVTADGSSMVSDFYDYSTSMPTAPTLNSVASTTTAGKVSLAWTNNWKDATGVIIAWTDDPDNWMSNDDPETYEIGEVASHWYITGLDTGKKWYFRVRSVMTTNESTTFSPWSSDVSIDLSSAPAVPVLYLSEEVITAEGMVTAYWSYVTTDGTSQVSGNVVTAEYSGGTWTYGDSVGATTDAQHIDIYAENQGWTEGTTVYLALQTRSGSGGISDYSTPVQLVIAAQPTVAISETSLATTETLTEYFEGDGSTTSFVCAYAMSASPSVTADGTSVTVSSYSDDTVTLASAPDDGAQIAVTYTTSDNNVLTEMPLTATVTTTGASALTVAVERATAYPMLRPDGTFTDGALGETIYVDTVGAESSNSISIATDDLIGRLDDGAWYNFIATASDEYGQSAEASVRFKVHWSHQAEAPTATFTTDSANYIARITPVAPSGYENGDTCDIYRLGADQPELIVTGGAFGTEYVDPYPAFGINSGYKVVTVTANNDYITEDDEFAEYDTIVEDDGAYTQLDPGLLIIDFDGDRVELPYNIALDNSWTKDFQRTTYLGGHVAGDHNRAVTRDLSASTVLVRDLDEDTAIKMRALAGYAGLCHVRTPEGSSFTADVQVSEDRSYDSASIDYSLSIQKVDTVGYDGMTYTEWSELQ